MQLKPSGWMSQVASAGLIPKSPHSANTMASEGPSRLGKYFARKSVVAFGLVMRQQPMSGRSSANLGANVSDIYHSLKADSII